MNPSVRDLRIRRATVADVPEMAESPASFYAHHGAQALRPRWLLWPDIASVLERPK